MKRFEWENIKNGTFFLHGDRWHCYHDKILNCFRCSPNYNPHLGQKIRYNLAMAKTLASKESLLKDVVKLNNL